MRVFECGHVGVCDVVIGNKLARAVRFAVGGIEKAHAGFNRHGNRELHPRSHHMQPCALGHVASAVIPKQAATRVRSVCANLQHACGSTRNMKPNQ